MWMPSKKDGKIQFSIKNISENPLNFQADELTERFIRGDVSRSTEGSGLGLSIAKNLTVLQHGSFNIYLDGDLFKVTITFDEAVKEKKTDASDDRTGSGTGGSTAGCLRSVEK